MSNTSNSKEFISTLAEPRKTEFTKIHNFITTNFPELKPVILGKGIGYGPYHYKYRSGREGDWALVVLTNNAKTISFHILAVNEKMEYLADANRDEFSKAEIGKGCIRYKKFDDIESEFPQLKKLITEAQRMLPKMLAFFEKK